MPARKRQSRLISYLFLLVNTVTWGAALIIVKPAFAITTPFRFLWYRYAFAVLASLPLLFYYLPRVKNIHKALKTIVSLELLGTTLALSLLYFGLSKTSAIEASMLTTTTPIFVSLGAIWLLREREERHEWVGLTIAFLGTILLTLVPLLYGHSIISKISFTGNLLIIAQNILIALYYVLAKKYYTRLPKLFATTISFYVGLVTFSILSLWEAGNISALRGLILADLSVPAVWIASVYMAVFGSIIGLTALIKGQDGIEASEATLFTYLEPLIYIPLGIFLLREHIYPLQILALAMILFGVVVAERRR